MQHRLNLYINKCEVRKVNEIEQKFFNAYLESEEVTADSEYCYLKPGVQIDIYKVDFLYDGAYVIEIDGHEYHKTKDQRFYDYQRERYLMKKGYIVIRFMATEVFLNPIKCIEEMFNIMIFFDDRRCSDFEKGKESSVERQGKANGK